MLSCRHPLATGVATPYALVTPPLVTGGVTGVTNGDEMQGVEVGSSVPIPGNSGDHGERASTHEFGNGSINGPERHVHHVCKSLATRVAGVGISISPSRGELAPEVHGVWADPLNQPQRRDSETS